VLYPHSHAFAHAYTFVSAARTLLNRVILHCALQVLAAGGNKYRSSATEARGTAVPHYRTLSAALEGEKDAGLVYVGTPPSTHSALVCEALAAGRHVLMEKPLAASAIDADAIVSAADASYGESRVIHDRTANTSTDTCLLKSHQQRVTLALD
jgi:predicted dehydrogenase